MASLLEPTQHDERQQGSDVQRVGRRIESCIDRRRLVQQFPEVDFIGRLVNKPSPLQFVDN